QCASKANSAVLLTLGKLCCTSHSCSNCTLKSPRLSASALLYSSRYTSTKEASNPSIGKPSCCNWFKNCAAVAAVLANSRKKPFTCCGLPLGKNGSNTGLKPSFCSKFN